MRGSAGLLAEPGYRQPHQLGATHCIEVDVGGLDLKIRSGRLSIEPEGEVVRREYLTEGDRRQVLDIGHYIPVIDTELAESPAHEPTEWIVTDASDDRRFPAETGCRHGDVRRGAAEILAEGPYVLKPDAYLQRIYVHPAAAEGQHVQRPGRPTLGDLARFTAHCSPTSPNGPDKSLRKTLWTAAAAPRSGCGASDLYPIRGDQA